MAKVPRSLGGKVIVITGGGRGIGRATAAALIAQGARVAIGDIEADLAQRTAQELGGGTPGLPLDVTRRESFETFLGQVEERLGPLDVLINNAGIMPIGPYLEETDTIADRIVDINLRGVMLGSKLALARFVPRRAGHLVNIASIAGKAGSAHLATYCATKHAVVGLTASLRQEFLASGINFSVVMPVGTNTELYSGLKQLRGVKTPEPEDVADAIVEALQTGRYEVYVPKRMNAVIRSGALLPTRAMDAVAKVLGGGEAITTPDHAARAAYTERVTRAQAGPAGGADAPASADAPSPASEAAPAEPDQASVPLSQ
ncbi:MAG TPA: SDR family oxidoreductase [Solirubrobacteraceae bacterium]|nr:SDR family oxidoreductase [Solirubrobacteraceae bacterium]